MNRLQIDFQIHDLLKGRSYSKVRELLLRHFRVNLVSKLTNEQAEKFIKILEEEIQKGTL